MRKKQISVSLTIPIIDRLQTLGLKNADGLRGIIEKRVFQIEMLKKNNIDQNLIEHIFLLGLDQYIKNSKK